MRSKISVRGSSRAEQTSQEESSLQKTTKATSTKSKSQKHSWKGFMQRLEDRLGEMAKTKNPLQRSFVKGYPFIQIIVDYPTTSKFKPPIVTPKYDGKADPALHIELYQAAADIYSVPNQMRCRAFSNSIIGPAQIWYNNLSRGKNSSFHPLTEMFIDNFCFGAKPIKSFIHILTVCQKPGKTTPEYITRFNNEKLEVIDYEEKTAIAALMSGLLAKDLYYALAKNPHKTMTELMVKVGKIMNAEEAMAAKETP